MVSKVDHIGVLVDDIDENRALFELLDLPVGRVEHVPSFGVDIAFIRVGESLVELVEPVTEDTPLAEELTGTSQSALLHHIAFRVDDIESRLASLQRENVPLVDETPRQGAGGATVAFLEQRAANGVRIELVERSEDVDLGEQSCR